ncbi:hypothetical protein A3753_18470 [Sulfitobacter sp. HI0082]|nr:hypothetical protein A3753_18470 [Sulfitobacter sp. HI0082]
MAKQYPRVKDTWIDAFSGFDLTPQNPHDICKADECLEAFLSSVLISCCHTDVTMPKLGLNSVKTSGFIPNTICGGIPEIAELDAFYTVD